MWWKISAAGHCAFIGRFSIINIPLESIESTGVIIFFNHLRVGGLINW